MDAIWHKQYSKNDFFVVYHKFPLKYFLFSFLNLKYIDSNFYNGVLKSCHFSAESCSWLILNICITIIVHSHHRYMINFCLSSLVHYYGNTPVKFLFCLSTHRFNIVFLVVGSIINHHSYVNLLFIYFVVDRCWNITTIKNQFFNN